MVKLYKFIKYSPQLFSILIALPTSSVWSQVSRNGNLDKAIRVFGDKANTNIGDVHILPNEKSNHSLLNVNSGLQRITAQKAAKVLSNITTWNGTTWDFGIPGPTISAIIVGNYSGPGFSCSNLNVNAGITFSPGGDIEIKGNATCNLDMSSGKLIFNGTNPQQFSGFANDLTLDNTAGLSVAGSSTINGTLKLQSGTLVTNDNLILNSTSIKTARVAKIEAGAAISGNVSVKRHVPGATSAWHFMGVPVTGQTQANWSDNFTILPNFIYSHNESGSLNIEDQVNGWEMATGSLEPGKGYRTFLNQSFMNSTATFDNKGPLVTGDFSYPITFSNTGFDGGGWNFLSNPYACEVDWDSFSKSLIGGQLHIWNQDQYGSYSSGLGIGVNGGSRYLSSFQGFFVKATGIGASLSLTESSKPSNAQANTFLRVAADPGDVARITLRGPGGQKDETAIRWMSGADPFFETQFDADKLMNPSMSFFSTTQEGRRTSIQARNFSNSDIVDFGYRVNQSGPHFLEIHIGQDIFEGKTWELRDNETGFIYPATADMLFPFEIFEGSESSNYRFSLIGLAPLVGSKSETSNQLIAVYPNPATETCCVSFPDESVTFNLSDILGKKVKEGTLFKNNGGKIDLQGIPSGVYQIRVLTSSGSFLQKIQVY
jgi:hypothetical protein